jgi:hypothetical protein
MPGSRHRLAWRGSGLMFGGTTQWTGGTAGAFAHSWCEFLGFVSCPTCWAVCVHAQVSNICLLNHRPAGLGWCLVGVVRMAYALYVGCPPWELILVIVDSFMDAGGDVTVERRSPLKVPTGSVRFGSSWLGSPLLDAASRDPSSAACSCV